MIRSSSRISLIACLKTALIASLVLGCSGAEDKTLVAAQSAALGQSAQPPSAASAPAQAQPERRGPEQLIARFDQNKDGKLATSELPERARERWAKADANGDGVLEAAEIKSAMQARGAERFARADKNGDGKLTESEVGAEHWKFMGRADTNGDQAVTKEELEQAHQAGKMGPGPGGPGGHRGGGPKMFEQSDKNGDGKLTESEVGADKWKFLARADTNKDQAVTKEELEQARPAGKMGPGGPGEHRGGEPRMFERFDKNNDGRLTADEAPAPAWEHLRVADSNQDGAVTQDEIKTARSQGKLVPPKGRPGPAERTETPKK